MDSIEPIFDKHPCAIITSSDSRYVPYLSVLIQSIICNSSDSEYYDIIILNEDIPEEDQRLLSEQKKNHDNISIRFFNVGQMMESHHNLHTYGHFRIETYYRFLIPEIMPEYTVALYLDADMVVNRDLSVLLKTDLGNNYVAACRDADTAGLYNGAQIGKKDYFEKVLKIVPPYDYFQAGMILFNIPEIKKTFVPDDFFECANSRNWELLDQDVLNHLMKGRVKYVDMGWNTMYDWGAIRSKYIISLAPADLQKEYCESREKMYIIHYAGPNKPWDTEKCDMAEYFWKYAELSPFYDVILSRYNTLPRKKVSKKARLLYMLSYRRVTRTLILKPAYAIKKMLNR